MSEVEEVEAKVYRRGQGWVPLADALGSAGGAIAEAVAPAAGPAPAAGVGNAVVAFRDFSDDDLAAAREALVAIDEAAANDLMVARHLGRAPDGRFVVGLRVPRFALSPENRDKPWDEYQMGAYVGFRFTQTWFELADGIKLLRSDDCPEAEARRRDDLRIARDAAGQADIARERAKREEEDLLAAEQRRAREARGLADWQQTLPWARDIYRLAEVFRKRGEEDLAREIAAIARNINRSAGGDAINGPDLPETEWRR